MPLYSFYCENCKIVYEILIKLIDSDRPVKCPKCGKILVKKMDAPYFRIN